MKENKTIAIQHEFIAFIEHKNFACIGAKTALAKNQLSYMIAGHIACPMQDEHIVSFLYSFIDNYRLSDNHFHSAAILFTSPEEITEDAFESALWQRLQHISDIDAKRYGFDKRVSSNIHSALFSFSIKEEALFVVGMHAGSSREARRFRYPVIVFNPHAQFEALKQTKKYRSIQSSVRKRELSISGSINPMLSDHAISPEIVQYSGKNYGNSFTCPLKINHANT